MATAGLRALGETKEFTAASIFVVISGSSSDCVSASLAHLRVEVSCSCSDLVYPSCGSDTSVLGCFRSSWTQLPTLATLAVTRGVSEMRKGCNSWRELARCAERTHLDKFAPFSSEVQQRHRVHVAHTLDAEVMLPHFRFEQSLAGVKH